MRADAERRHAELSRIFARQSTHNPHRLHAHAHDLPDQPHDVLLIILPVRVGADFAAFVFGDLVLVDDPFEGAAVAAAVVKRLGRDAGQGERRVDANG